MEEVAFVVCLNCDTPCYFVRLQRSEGHPERVLRVCGNDEIKEFRLPSDDEVEEE
jgi:hypothetical protein